MAAMKISKEIPAPRRGIDPPSSVDTSPSFLTSSSPVARGSSPLVPSSSSSIQLGMLPKIFPIPHVRNNESEEETKKKQNLAPLESTSSACPVSSPRKPASATTTTRITMDASFISTASSPPPPPASLSVSSSAPPPVSSSSTTRTAIGGSLIQAGGGTRPTTAAAPPPVKQQQPQKQIEQPPPPPAFLRSSMHTSSNNTGPRKPRKSVRYAFVQIYEHDLDKEVRSGASVGGGAAAAEPVQSYELTEYEAQRGPRRPPKFFQKSDQERQGLRKLREMEERQAEQEWQKIRQETISIQEEVSFMSAPGGGGDGDYFDSNQSVRSTRSEASFANASFYEGFEDRFKVKNKKKKSSLGSRFGRLFFRKRRFSTGGRPTDGASSMIGEL